ETLERNSLIGSVFGMELGQGIRCRHCEHHTKPLVHAEYCIYLRTGQTETDIHA
ncbi:unnamed protein product, partial [Durusdinium trenchii]